MAKEGVFRKDGGVPGRLKLGIERLVPDETRMVIKFVGGKSLEAREDGSLLVAVLQ